MFRSRKTIKGDEHNTILKHQKNHNHTLLAASF